MQVSTTRVCLGNTVSFSVTVTGATVSSYKWSFGNSATANQASPLYQYPATGTFTPVVKVYFTSGDSCTSTGPAVEVLPLPSTAFTFTTQATQCFNGNALCIKDLSVPGGSGARLDTGNLYWDDGTKVYFKPIFGQVFCHSYSDPFGGIYSPVIEIADSNGCLSRLKKTDSITVYTKMGKLDFLTAYTLKCPQTPVTITNQSTIPVSQVAHYEWHLGDGTIDSTHWNSFTHTYTANGTFDIRLIVTDINGCTDTLVKLGAAKNAILDPVIHLNSDHSCYKNNKFTFTSNNPGAQVKWALYNDAGVRIDTTPTLISPRMFSNCGLYSLRMYVNYPGSTCASYTDTLIDVYGPNAVAQNDTARIVNQIQCQIHDTVYFRTPLPELSCYNSTTMQRLWDFGDTYTGSPYLAEACTTDTKNNINVGRNCRWSKDSVNVWHMYSPGTEGCFRVILYMEDPVRGCSDADTAYMKLTRPEAGPDTSAAHAWRGVYYTGGTPCLERSIRFMYDDVLPRCGFDSAWFMPDSACGGPWIPLQKGKNDIFHTYLTTCDTSGWVTYGVVIKNGNDNSGNVCYDTAWYHRKLLMLPIKPQFTYKVFGTCPPYTIVTAMVDSTQDSIATVGWTVINSNGSPPQTFTQQLLPTDSTIHGQTFTTGRGMVQVSVDMVNFPGCTLSYSAMIALGPNAGFQVLKNKLCLGDTIRLYDHVRYFISTSNTLENPVNYWADTNRAKAGKEQIWWDIGDGSGFSITGSEPLIRYTQPGTYTIKMAIRDSLGCFDTIVQSGLVDVVDVDAQMKYFAQDQFCAPFFLDLNDSTIVRGNDAISTWEWNFSDNKPHSTLQDPQHEFTSNDTFTVKLVVTTVNGCMDSITRMVDVRGPRPKFDIITDTIGCSPLSVTFKNTTGYQLVNWQWNFHDQANTIISTKKDTNVTFAYKTPGVYAISLFGIDTIRDPATNTLKTCSVYFPDVATNLPVREVTVLPSDTMQIIGPENICPNEPHDFIARGDTTQRTFSWNFGDGSPFTMNFPDSITSYTFTKSGTYKVKLVHVLQGGACADTAYKIVKVQDIEADFDIDYSRVPVYHFNNTSVNAVSYKWFVGKELANLFSTENMPDHEFGDTGAVLVCLQAFNRSGCWDTACKEIAARAKLVVPNVFTPGNADGKNDAFDIDIVGATKYELVIYNRWGTRVYESTQDGQGNDGVNWNGKDHNTGPECSHGVYFYVFKYGLITGHEEKTLHGTITLIRPE